MEEFFELIEPQGTAEGCGHREAVRYLPCGFFRLTRIYLFLWIISISALGFRLLLIVFLIVILLAHIAEKNELLLPGSPMKSPLMITLFVVDLIILVLNLIVLEAFSNALFIAHMDT